MRKKNQKSFCKNMKGKNFVLSLCCISLIGIGFSSWIYSEPSYQSIDFNVSVGDVINRVFFNIISVQTFTLGPDGLVEDYTIVDSSSIVCYFTINNSAVYEVFDSNQLKFETTLSCSDDAFISKYIDSNPIIEGATSVDYFLSGASLTNYFLTSISSNDENTNMNIVYNVNDDGTINSYFNKGITFSFLVRPCLNA